MSYQYLNQIMWLNDYWGHVPALHLDKDGLPTRNRGYLVVERTDRKSTHYIEHIMYQDLNDAINFINDKEAKLHQT